MTTTAERWRLDVIAQGARMVDAAKEHVPDLNEAHWLVHMVMLRTMTDMLGPSSRRDLDTALGRALRRHEVLPYTG
ncbi:MAG: hypothetical protein AB7O98_04560 [Hyphomonadaceae bacterium]